MLKIHTMKTKILNYLKSDRSYNEGVKLFMQFGKSASFKQVLNRQSYTDYTHKVLLEQLRLLAGISEQEFKAIIAKPVTLAAKMEVVEKQAAIDATPVTPEEKVKFIAEIPEQVRKAIRLRDQFPFLAEADCPDEFKILVHDMISAYANYVEGHSRLFEATTVEELQEIAADVVEDYLENHLIWDELNHFKETGKILGKHEIFATTDRMLEIRNMTTAEHTKLHNSLKSNISKTKKLVEKDPEHKNTAERKQSIARWEVELEEVKRILGLNA